MHGYTVIQDGIKECGSACILSVIKYYGGYVPINEIVSLTNTTKDGTNFYDMHLACKELGLSTKGYKLNSINELNNYNLPLISQVVINNLNHFIVVYKIKKDIVTIMDPAKGMRKIKLSSLENIWTSYILTIYPYKELPKYSKDNYLKNIFINLLKENKKNIIILSLSTFLITILTCIYSYYLELNINKLTFKNNLSLIIIFLIFIIILFIKQFLEYFRNNLLLYLNKNIDLSIITKTIKKIIFLPYNYYKNKTTGEVISRVNDLFYIKNVISRLLVTFILDLSMVLVSYIILFKINKIMTLLLIIIIVIYIIISLIYRPHIKDMTDITQEDNSKINSFLTESINGYNSIKGLNLENTFFQKIKDLYQNSINNNITFSKLQNTEELLTNLFENIIILLITTIGISKVMDKSLNIGSLITYNTIMYYFLLPIKDNIFLYKDIYYIKNSITRINNILNIPIENFNNHTDKNIFGDIIISNLNFAYSNRIKVLNNISLKINKGEKVLILGNTGCGKSTLLKILYKYYDIDKNMIKINNHDISHLTLSDIRSKMAYLSQNEVIYTDTIRNNIILDREITEEEFKIIADLTYTSDIVKDNILKYDYYLQESGSNLSGGQRQRIILARTLLKKCDYYLIDEGLNEIDSNLERKILLNIFNKYSDKTFIIVSHRKENINLFDKVITLKNNNSKKEKQ